MEIITQMVLTEACNFIFTQWKGEAMTGIIVFLITYFLMKKRIQHYKELSEIYEQELKKTCSEISEIKRLVTILKDDHDKAALFKKIEELVTKKLSRRKPKQKQKTKYTINF